MFSAAPPSIAMMMSRTFCPWTVREIPLYWGCWTTGCLGNHRHRHRNHRHCHDNHQHFTLAGWGQFRSLAMFLLSLSSSSFPPVNHLEPSGVSRSVPRSVHGHLECNYDNIWKVIPWYWWTQRCKKQQMWQIFLCYSFQGTANFWTGMDGNRNREHFTVMWVLCGHSTDLILEFFWHSINTIIQRYYTTNWI